MGRAAPPPNPPLSFQAVQACFQEHRTIRRTASGTCLHHPSCQQRQNPSGRVIKTLCLQVERAAPVTRTVSSTYNCDTGIFQSSKYRPSACKRSPRGPCIFVSCARSLQVSSYQPKQNPSGPVKKTLCLQSFQVSSCQQEQNPSGFVINTLCLQVGGGCARNPLVTSCKAKSLQIKFPTGLVQIQPCRLQFPSCPI